MTSKRYKLVGMLALVPLFWVVPGAGTAAADASCAPFERVQTYEADAGFYRAPAWYFGRTVTIRYEGTSCSSVSGQELVTRIEGTATIYGGGSASGQVLESRPFNSTEVRGVADPAAFPGWWSCAAPAARYSWTISGVYTFTAAGSGGRWNHRQIALAESPRSAGSSFDSCGSR